MNDTAVNGAAAFTFCPKCGTSLAEGRCAKCGWAEASLLTAARPSPKRRRFGILIAALALLILISVGLNTMLNFGSVVNWLPSDVLLWMDDGKSQASSELMGRFRRDMLSQRQVTSLVEQRLMDSALRVRSPYPVGLGQSLEIEHNCGVPAEKVNVQIEDWQLTVDGKPLLTSANVQTKPQGYVVISANGQFPSNARILPSREERIQKIDLPALDAGNHKIALAGQLTVRQGESNGEILFSRPIGLMKELDIRGQIPDYVRRRASERIVKSFRKSCAALAYWTGDQEGNNAEYALKLGVASPEVPFVMSVWVRIGSKGEFTRVGTVTVEPLQRYMAMGHELSLSEVPGISEARRLQVRLQPELITALKCGYKECFGGTIEWDNVPMAHRRTGYMFNPLTDEIMHPSRVRSDANEAG